MSEGPQRRLTWEVEASDEITYEISLEYAQPEQDEPRLIAMYRDITERKAAEKAKRDFIATVSHELRTPLTSIKAALGLAQSGAVGEMSEKIEKLVGVAGSNCDHLVMLINDILDLEKIEAGKMDFKMETFDLRELIDEALEANQFYAEKFSVKFVRNVPESETEHLTSGDRGRLRQVMDNLMSNAAKFSSKDSEIIVSLVRYNERLRISIRDFGSGIPAKAQPKIFNKFTQADSSDTRSKGGTGLGLSISKLIVESHKGRIFFVSEEEVGTEFFVDLPMMVEEELIPVPELIEGEVPVFSNASEFDDAIEIEEDAEVAIEGLLRKTRAISEEVEVEQGRVNAHQVIKGRGVVSQSRILTWLTGPGRSLMTELNERELLDNREVLIVEAQLAEDIPDNADQLPHELQLVTDWLREERKGEGEMKGIILSADEEAREWATKLKFVALEDAAQASTLVADEDFDAIVHLDTVEGTRVATVCPLKGGGLPNSLPVTQIVARQSDKQSERGVVSRFSGSGGGGRGRARRRMAS